MPTALGPLPGPRRMRLASLYCLMCSASALPHVLLCIASHVRAPLYCLQLRDTWDIPAAQRLYMPLFETSLFILGPVVPKLLDNCHTLGRPLQRELLQPLFAHLPQVGALPRTSVTVISSRV